LLGACLDVWALVEARPPLPETPDTTLWQSNRAVKRTVAEGISAAKAISAVALVAANAVAEKAISVSAEEVVMY
jgi:hypothetical protein